MKKLLLSSLLFGSVFSFAQNQRTAGINTPNTPVSSHKKATYSQLHKTNPLQKTASTTGSTWVNYVDFIELVSPGTQVFSAMHLFPDSAIVLGYDASSQPVYPWIHKAGNYMDPSFNAQQTILTDKTTPYTVDSVSVGYIYNRAMAVGVVDTLVFQIIAENHALDYTLTGPPAFSYQDIEYNQPVNELKSSISVLKKIKYPLTINDTCEGGVYKQIKVATAGIAIAAGKKVGCVISYIPGSAYTTTDVLIGDATNPATQNVFFILSSEQNGNGGGAGTDPTYYGTSGDFTTDMNQSYILPSDVRYNTNANGWNGYFLPTYAFATAFAYETHDIGYRITVLIAGVKELEQKGFALGQNTPNPFTSASEVNYQLAKDATSAIFTVTDVMGRVISSEKVDATSGVHAIKLGAYAAGVYYYSLNVDGNITTKKMIVE